MTPTSTASPRTVPWSAAASSCWSGSQGYIAIAVTSGASYRITFYEEGTFRYTIDEEWPAQP